MKDLYNYYKIIRYDKEGKNFMEDAVITEFPLVIKINGRKVVTLVCSPQYLQELSIGYLYSEGLINRKDFTIQKINDNEIECTIKKKNNKSLKLDHKIITSGCGKSTVFTELNGRKIKKIRSDKKINKEVIFYAVNKLYKKSETFQKTGGVHNSLLLDIMSRNITFREDIGRHNTVDKLIGHLINKNKEPDNKILVVSGRISAEILLKTARIGIPFLISPSAPTDRALRLSRRLGITLIGFVRGKRMNIYANADRIK